MKRQITLVLIGIALLFGIRGQSQSIAPFVLNASGGTYDNPSSYTRFEWNFGELVLIDTYTAGNFLTTNGLLQPCTDNVVSDPLVLFFGINEYKLFPNITTGPFELDFFLNIPGRLELQLTDALGRVLNKRNIVYHCCDHIERFDISNQPNGVYFINALFVPEIGTNIGLSDRMKTVRKSTFRVVKGGK